jgi:hypothetical protein
MSTYAVEPLRAVGLEGIFGLGTTVLGMSFIYLVYGRTTQGRGGYFDVPQGIRDYSNSAVLWSSIAIAISIAFFNWFGLAVTKSWVSPPLSMRDCFVVLNFGHLGSVWQCFCNSSQHDRYLQDSRDLDGQSSPGLGAFRGSASARLRPSRLRNLVRFFFSSSENAK